MHGKDNMKCKNQPRWNNFNRTRQCLAYADDVVILGRSEGYIKGTLEEMAADAVIDQTMSLQIMCWKPVSIHAY
jgi:hypothetical protein